MAVAKTDEAPKPETQATPEPPKPAEGTPVGAVAAPSQHGGETPDSAAAPTPGAGQAGPVTLSPFHEQIAKRGHIPQKWIEKLGAEAPAFLEEAVKPRLDAEATRYAEIGRRLREQEAGQGSQATPAPPTPQAPPQTAPQQGTLPAQPKLPSSWGFGVDFSEWNDPASADTMRQMESATRQGFQDVEARLEARIAQLAQQVQPFVQREEAERTRRIQRDVDAWFDSQAPQYGERYGVGPTDSFIHDPNSAPGKERRAVLDLAGNIAAGWSYSGREWTWDEALDTAQTALQRPTNPTQDDAAQRMRTARAAGITPQPGTVPPPSPPDPRKEAADAQRQWFAERNKRLAGT